MVCSNARRIRVALAVGIALLASFAARSARSVAAEDASKSASVTKQFFNGKDLSQFDGRQDVFRAEDGQIVGQSKEGLKNNEFLKNKMVVKDFRLTCKVKLTPDAANSGIQFRSVALENSPEMRGYQADAGKGWWGKLYHESGRQLLWDKAPPEGTVKTDDWNTYEVVAVGHHILTAINGVKCVDLEDEKGELEGRIAFQVHSGGPTEVRFKDIELELDPKPELKTLKK
jgi:hypothetical protein